MNELTICDHFKWTLEYLRTLTIVEYKHVLRYLKKLGDEQKKAMRKAKSKRR